ncbi:MAG: lytic transglycosylase domain-containing protein [Gammaproteobacteria bacterium]
MVSALLIHDVPIECINQAAVTYYVPAQVIISVLNVEGGRAGTASLNRNGTFDYGPMQINSKWLPKIAPYGYTREQIQYDPCVNVMVGAWILSTKIADSVQTQGGYWHGVAGYHSLTPTLNDTYQTKVLTNYEQLSRVLSQAET